MSQNMWDCFRLEAPTTQESSVLLPNSYFQRSKQTLQQKILLTLKKKSIIQKIMASLILLFSSLIYALTFYPIFFQLNAMVTKFESTVLLPDASPDKQSPANDYQGFWPGLETGNADFVFQNVIFNWNPDLKPGEWSLFPSWCCKLVKVHPGDTINSTFALDDSTGISNDEWDVTRGQQGKAAGQGPFSGSLLFDPTTATVFDAVPYTMAILTIELQEEATWDFGSATWTDITIEAVTTDTSCPTSFSSLKWPASQGIASTSGGKTSCYYAKIVLEGPI
ncbi:hypothetical protein NA56DRAFT_705865 [Hyaloscypha hepaticicola]|uniref:Concanavalin A-like lectin/glucanase n=1 Tax=Hyaloscypha hepaticicola TaxID=2082293 RepID=A0A2J6PZ41_9HELO|nr:hypothetical protein NA56DRAFT_705865 [Hyaloscypha hepaticicola]